MAVTGDTQLALTKMEVISELVQRELISQAVLVPTIMDVSRFAGKGAKQISFPKATSFTVEDRASAAVATVQDIDFTKDTMDLDFRLNVSWAIDPNDEIESVVDVDAEYSVRAARAHAVRLDQLIIAELETVGVEEATATGDIDDTKFLTMRKSLLGRRARRNALRFVASPDQEAVLLGINKFVNVDFRASQPVSTGEIGTLYGVPVIISPELGAQQYFMYEEEGCAIGFQRAPQLDERKAPEYGAGAMLKILEQKLGIQGLQLGQQGVGATLSALVVKDANA